MSSTDSWLLFLNWPFSCWELGRLSFHNFLAARPPEWQALEAGLLVPHMYPTLFQDSWKGNHQIHGEMLMFSFVVEYFLTSESHIQYLLISWVSWEMDLPGDQIRLVRRNVFISSSRIRCKAWAVMGFNFPHRCSSVEPHEPRELGLFTTSTFSQQMFSWVRLHLQFIHLPLFPFHYNLLQSREPWGSSERVCSDHGPIYSKRSSVQNIVAALKNDSKKHLSLQVLAFFGNACFVRCCSWMDIPPRWWTFYAWPLLGRELMGRHCKGC